MSLPTLERILYVEDDPDIREVARLALEVVGGLTILACESGEDALARLPGFAPDLLLLDVMMPGMDGPTLLRRLRAIDSSCNVPAIFMTAKMQPDEITDLERIGAIGVIPKPFDPMRLTDNVRTIWIEHQVRRSGATGDGGLRTTSIDQTVNRLAVRFFHKLPARITEIADLWRLARGPATDRQALADLHRKVHSLTGTASTFGFAAVTAAARKFERALFALLNTDAASVASQIGTLEQFQLGLEAAANATHRPEADADAASAPGEAASSPPDPPGARLAEGRRVIYLLGTGPSSLDTLRNQLESNGYDVRSFDSPVNLEAAIVRQPPTAIVSDGDLADGQLAGAALATRLAAAGTRRPPMIFISDRGDLRTRLQSVHAGAAAFFTRPIPLASLIDKLDQLGARALPEPFRVMIVEDAEDQAALYAAILREAGMRVTVIADPNRLLGEIDEFHPELILMDMYLPECSGDDLARVVRQLDAFVGIPIVFLSVEDNFDRQLNAIGRGGDEFLTKPIKPAQLLAAIAGRIERYRILRTLMVQDSLTGLNNHSRLQQQLESEVARALRENTPLAIAMIDIDHFKNVNDTHGHPTGDRVLRTLARFVRQSQRQSDIVARYGGEEFAIVMPNTDAGDADAVIDRLRSRFATLVHDGDKGESFNVTFSAGVATLAGRNNARELLLAADAALYQAKAQGRNCVVVAQDGVV